MFATASGLLDDLERAIDKVLASEDLSVFDLPRLRRQSDRLVNAFAVVARGRGTRGALDALSRTPSGVIAAGCRISNGKARRVLSAGRSLESLPATRAAALEGSITPDHVRVITDAHTPERAAVFEEQETALVEFAQRFTPRELSFAVRRLCDAIDGGDTSADERERRNLHVSWGYQRRGVINGELDPVGTEIVITALEHRMTNDPDAPGDKKRTRPQRRADALTDICGFYLKHHDDAATTRRRGLATVGVTVDLNELRKQGHGPLVDHVHADLEYTGRVSRETLRRLTCDANVHRVLTDRSSEPLDVGRSRRTVNKAQWRALVARDNGCTHPDCTAPPGWCEAHHIKHWADGGPTNIDNLKLKCQRHHTQEHEGRARGP